MLGSALAPAHGVDTLVLAADARAVGVTESLLKFCKRADPADVPRVQMKIDRLLHGVSRADATSIRKSEEYLSAYAAMTDFVGKVDPHNARRLCAPPGT